MKFVVRAPWRMSVAAIAVASVLQGCGGGGGESSPPPSPTPPSVLVTPMQQPHEYDLSATAEGVSFEAVAQFEPGADIEYQGVAYATTTLTATYASGGQALGSSTEVVWLDKASGQPVLYATDDGVCGVVTSARVDSVGDGSPLEGIGARECSSTDQAMTLTGLEVPGGAGDDGTFHQDMPGPILRGYFADDNRSASFEILLAVDPLRVSLVATLAR